MNDVLFMLAGGVNFVAGLLHIWVIVTGPEGYRRFGAGERMAEMAAEGRLYPRILTAGIAGALFFFSWLCLSQTQAVPAPLFAREILWLLTAAYLVRGLIPLVAYRWVPLFQTRFFVVSSLIVLIFGVIHLAALMA